MQAPTPVLESIALQKCLMATYNKLSIKLAPHILYTRHGEMFIDAVTMEREGQPPRELKLGVFKLAGLNDLRTVEESFDQMGGLYDPDDRKYKGVTLFAIDPQTASV